MPICVWLTNNIIGKMEKRYFKVKLEFDPKRYDYIVDEAVKNNVTGYCCAVEANNLSYAHHHPDFMEVMNGALVNSCDGAVIAKILARIHHEDIDCYPGTDIFDIYTARGKYRQFFLGNTPEVLASLKENLVAKRDPKIADMQFETPNNMVKSDKNYKPYSARE